MTVFRWEHRKEGMSAVEKANHLCHDLGYEPAVGCGCGGFWWYDGGRLVMATHAEGCERADAGWTPSLSHLWLLGAGME